MAVIDIGCVAITRGDNWSNVGYTLINRGNPANGLGKITNIEIYIYSAMNNIEVATFYVESGNFLSTRDTQAIGNLGVGYHSFGVDLDVQTGDYLGIYSTSGWLEMDFYDNDGVWYISSDEIPCSNTEFTISDTAASAVSLYGTGTGEVPTGAKKKNVIFTGNNF